MVARENLLLAFAFAAAEDILRELIILALHQFGLQLFIFL